MKRPRTNRLNRIIGRGLLVLALAPPLEAQLVEVKNDSIVDFGSAAIQAGFVAGERAAAWLTPQCPGDLVAVRILWLDLFNSGTQSLGDTITISADGTFPVPGSILAELIGPVLTEGFFNEFPLVPPIPVLADQTFVVDFKFFSNPPPLGPSLATDTDGCQATKNGVFAIPPSSWLDLCPLGVSGDLAIRAVVNCDSLIFADGFESGDTSAWSVVEPPTAWALPLTFDPITGYPILNVDPLTFIRVTPER